MYTQVAIHASTIGSLVASQFFPLPLTDRLPLDSFLLSSSGLASVSLTLWMEPAEVDSPYWSLNAALLASQPVHPKVPV